MNRDSMDERQAENGQMVKDISNIMRQYIERTESFEQRESAAMNSLWHDSGRWSRGGDRSSTICRQAAATLADTSVGKDGSVQEGKIKM